jgi:hypothetical protein
VNKILSQQVARIAVFFGLFFLQFMVAHAATSSGRVALVMDLALPRAKVIKNLFLNFNPVAEVSRALDAGRYHLAIIDATPANLQSLRDNTKELGDFTSRGGWVMLWGLTPDGLPIFNQIVSVDHVMRPFVMEKVAMPVTPNPLVSGLTDDDFHMESAKQTPQPGAVNFLVDDAFSYVVDFDDIAPFCTLPPAAYWGRPDAILGWDNWPANMVNGLDDYWRFCFTIPLSKPEYSKWTMKLPREEEIVGFSIVRDNLNSRITKVHLLASGQTPVDLDVTKDNARQNFSFPGFRAKELNISIEHDLGKPPSAGIGNLWIKVKRSPDFYAKVKPLASIGVLVAYPQGSGGIVLNQLAIPDTEAVAANAEKKQTILQVLLANLGASFTSGDGKPEHKVEWLQKGTAWEDPANWAGGKVPGPDDLAVFPLPENNVATVNPTLKTAILVKGLRFYNGLGALGFTMSIPMPPPLPWYRA